MKLTGRNPGKGKVSRKAMPTNKGNAIPPKALRGGGVDDTGGDAVARQISRLSEEERPPHSAMNAQRNTEDVYQPGERRMKKEQGPPLPAGRQSRKVLRGRGRSGTR